MKFYYNFFIVLIFVSFLFYCSCKSTSEPLTPKSQDKAIVEIQLVITPYTEVPSMWDSTFYQHDVNWGWSRFFDTTAANLLTDSLKEYVPPVTDMWFPQDVTLCLAPIRVGSEVILKLNSPDTSVYQLGFQPADGFPLACVPTWRHYRFVMTEAGK